MPFTVDPSSENGTACCAGGECGDTRPLSRRRFLAVTSAVAGAAALPPDIQSGRRDVAAAVGLAADDVFVVPADKRIPASWWPELTARGRPTAYQGAALDHIGMPVGGGCAGQVYLGGDGRLWRWDIFNLPGGPADDTYRVPHVPSSPFRQGFALRVGDRIRALDSTGFEDVQFTGQYPIGRVDYRAAGDPVEVTLEAFSPFVPLAEDDSTIPATILAYTLRNSSDRAVEAELLGWSENPVGLQSRNRMPTRLYSTGFQTGRAAGFEFSAGLGDLPDERPDIVFEDWERPSYDGWTVEGTAFGTGPKLDAEVPGTMKWGGPLNVTGERFVTSFAYWQTAQGADELTGRLVSRPFTIQRRYLQTRVGGGSGEQTALRVVVDGAVVASASGHNAEPMWTQVFDLARWQGRTATIEIVDGASGGWGHVNVDDIVFTDRPERRPLSELPDWGTFALAALDGGARVRPSIAAWSTLDEVAQSGPGPNGVDPGERSQAGAVGVTVRIPPRQSRTVRFVIGWYFPVPDRAFLSFLTGADQLRHHYGTRFNSAQDVVRAVAADHKRLEGTTRLWVKTFYADSTLPHWFLERTFASASTLATMVCHRFHNGRFYGWEGTYCCPGNCQHVWNYAQAIARLFPALERDTRERVDLGIGFHPDTGEMGHRAEAGMTWAADGQAGTVLRCYREHLTAPDDRYLRRTWPRIRQAIEFMIGRDAGPDGTLNGQQLNTLDAYWYGEIAWISSMYVAALYAGAAMATVVSDAGSAERYRQLAEAGTRRLSTVLWNGESFIQLLDPADPKSVNYNVGCHADQMLGQSLAWQIGRLPRVLPADQCRAALDRVYLYSFTPDAAGWREINTKIGFGRWFAVENEHAVIMTTWPRGGAATAPGDPPNIVAMYFNESWTGQEYQLAAHMLAEGLVEKGLLLVRAVHERYRADKRNPYNEIECSEHYARAMASYGAFLTACGFELDAPGGHIGFAPRVGGDDFAAAFTAAEGWGLYRQRRDGGRWRSEIELRYGRLELSSVAVPSAGTVPPRITVDGRPASVRSTTVRDGRLEITLAARVVLSAGQTLAISSTS